MKIEKKHWIIIAVVVILIALWYFFLRKKSTTNESNFKNNPCANHTCPEGCTKSPISNGKCGCKCYRQGTAGVVWA